MSFFGATGAPVLDFWWRLLWVSKPGWVLPYLLFCGGECNVHSLRSTSGTTHANLLVASMQPQRWVLARIWTGNHLNCFDLLETVFGLTKHHPLPRNFVNIYCTSGYKLTSLNPVNDYFPWQKYRDYSTYQAIKRIPEIYHIQNDSRITLFTLVTFLSHEG